MSRRGIGTPRCCAGLYGRIGPVDTYMRTKICVCNHVSTHWWHVCLPWQTMPFASLLDIENPALAPTIELVLASDIFAYLSRNGLGTLVCGMGHFLVSFILASERYFHSGIKVTRDGDCECNHTLWRSTFPRAPAAAIDYACVYTDAEDFSGILLHLIYAATTDYSFSRAKESWSIFCARQ